MYMMDEQELRKTSFSKNSIEISNSITRANLRKGEQGL